MAITTLYFVRHGETDYNRHGIVQGRGVDAPLNEHGQRQAEALARRFAEVALDAIYTSPLQRARATAEAVRQYHPDLPFYQMADLEEMDWGDLEGKPCAPPYDAQIRRIYERWQAGDYAYPVPGGESVLDVQRRALRALQTILARHEGEAVLVVTHGRFLRILLASILPEYGLARMEALPHTNTAVNHLVCENGRFRALRLNCTAHLEGLAVKAERATEVVA
ncbi:histidine phosphatase family protein [Rhodothermus profundi]|uniref:Probable phosphoglycerate mutase n=1 Tax=Rhodothermus profundi TaxID=633813 RepID=A0A1M6Q7W3_9BACT|nr:histidine phosphatase family protein [Rhodothermus profundi]SHK16207.1 probable phosphoglycerate mutase [Rhodothermus profundi]